MWGTKERMPTSTVDNPTQRTDPKDGLNGHPRALWLLAWCSVSLHGVASGVVDQLAEEAGRNGGENFGAVALLRDLDGVEDGFYVGIAGTGRGAGLDAAKDRKEGRGLVG